MAVLALMMAAALVSGEPDGVIATAPATTVDLGATARPVAPSTQGATQEAVPHGLSTDAQIDRWIASRSTAEAPWVESAAGPVEERRMHGAASFGIGTGGYRAYGVEVTVPLGERAWLGLSYQQVENGYGYGLGGYGYGYGGYERGLDRPYSLRGPGLLSDKADEAEAFDPSFPRRGGPDRPSLIAPARD